jgi:hypothetical protein
MVDMAKKKASTGPHRSKIANPKRKRSGRRATARRRGRPRRARPEIVIKRTSGRKERFDLDRMARTTGRSGVPFLMARDVAKGVARRIEGEAKKQGVGRRKKTVTAARIRNMISKELHRRNESDVALSYSGERPVNTRQGRYELMRENQPMNDSETANRSKLRYDSATRFAKSTRPSSMK